MSSDFNENTRVKLPALVHLTRLGYKYLSQKPDSFKQSLIPETNICCVCMISAPDGIKKVFETFPEVTLIVAAVDSHLNNRGYIVPGMGDAGDRIFNT